MELNLKDKVVLITGGSRGIGRSVANAFAREGAKVVITATNKEKAEAVALEIKEEYKVDTLGLLQNASSSESCTAVINAVISTFSKLDVLVNNAGITKDKLSIQMTDEEWKAVIDTNLSGVFYTSREALKVMLKARSGAIVNVSSVVGKQGSAGQANYAAAKAGVIGMTKAMAKEAAMRGVRVNAVAPGFIQTDMTDVLPKELVEKIKELTPLKKFGVASDVADTILFLSSDKANFITGETISVDGGMSM